MIVGKCIYFGICFALFASGSEAYFSQGSLGLQLLQPEVAAVDSIETYKELNPGVKVEELESISLNATYRKIYTLGTRFTGDRLVAHGFKKQSWATPQNVGITVNYPTTGIGAMVTYCYFVVDQSSNAGKAYVIKGGLHQRAITIIVEAYSVTFMSIDSQIFGL